MFTRLGHFTVRRRRLMLAMTVLFVLAAGAIGTGVFGALESGGFDDPSSESARASQFLEAELGAGEPEVVLLVGATDPGASVDDPGVAAAGAALTQSVLAEPHVASAVSYWSLGQAPPLRSVDGTSALVVVDLDGSDAEVEEAVAAIGDAYAGDARPADGRSRRRFRRRRGHRRPAGEGPGQGRVASRCRSRSCCWCSCSAAWSRRRCPCRRRWCR